jgi:hypothetical protein
MGIRLSSDVMDGPDFWERLHQFYPASAAREKICWTRVPRDNIDMMRKRNPACGRSAAMAE